MLIVDSLKKKKKMDHVHGSLQANKFYMFCHCLENFDLKQYLMLEMRCNCGVLETCE